MHMASIYPYLLPLMEEYVFLPYRVDKDEIKLLSDTMYSEAVNLNDYESLCYLIYFALQSDFELDRFKANYEEAQNYVVESKDCLLMVMTWIYFMKRNHGKRCATQVKPLCKVAKELGKTDFDRYWLFCYEALTYSDLRDQWGPMKKEGISFIRNGFL